MKKKKTYAPPTSEAVVLDIRHSLLAGSETTGSGEGNLPDYNDGGRI